MMKRLILPVLLLFAVALPIHAQDDPPEGGGGRGMLGGGRGIHGTVTAISGTTVTIKTDEGVSYQVFTSPNTRIMKDRQPAKTADIHVGDTLMAGGEMDAKAKTVGAVFVAIVDAEQARKLREDFGKTWTAGKVTAIKDTTITIERIDNVSQSFSVDENTSFKKRRDSITLADIQVGDFLRAQGALKDGIFVAASVNVGRGPGEGRGQGEGRGPGSQGGPPPPQQ
jgi:hypothetical protein